MDREPKFEKKEQLKKSQQILEEAQKRLKESRESKELASELPKRLYEQVVTEKEGTLDRLVAFNFMSEFFEDDIKRAKKIFVPEKLLKPLKKELEKRNIETTVRSLGNIREKDIDPDYRFTKRKKENAEANLGLVFRLISAEDGDFIKIIPGWIAEREGGPRLKKLNEKLAGSGAIVEFMENDKDPRNKEQLNNVQIYTPLGSFRKQV